MTISEAEAKKALATARAEKKAKREAEYAAEQKAWREAAERDRRARWISKYILNVTQGTGGGHDAASLVKEAGLMYDEIVLLAPSRYTEF